MKTRPAPKMAVTLVQSNLHWEEREKNRAMFDALLQGLAGKTDLIILPEMFTTGFTMNTIANAETTPGPTEEWMLMKAADTGAAVTGSIIAREKGKYFNRMIWAHPSGIAEIYDKRHLFTMAGEDRFFTAGEKRLIVRHKGWKILPLVCYDLRFPVWARNRKAGDGKPAYDLLIYVANWPQARQEPWKKLLLARAIENQAFVAGVNRVGSDGKGINYSGDSAMIDPYGNAIAQCKPGQVQAITNTIEYKVLSRFREKFPVLDDADNFELKTSRPA